MGVTIGSWAKSIYMKNNAELSRISTILLAEFLLDCAELLAAALQSLVSGLIMM